MAGGGSPPMHMCTGCTPPPCHPQVAETHQPPKLDACLHDHVPVMECEGKVGGEGVGGVGLGPPPGMHLLLPILQLPVLPSACVRCVPAVDQLGAQGGHIQHVHGGREAS